jgi:hypothetical protein
MLFDWIAEKVGIEEESEWYNCNHKLFSSLGARTILIDYHDGSPCKALMKIYPDSDWQPWKFHKMPKRYFEGSENQLEYVRWIEDKLDLQADIE